MTLIPEGNEVEVPSVGDRPSRLMPQRLVAEILEPRARELFEMMRDNLRQSGMFDMCIAGIVLTGGASRLPGIFDVAESVLRRSVTALLARAASQDAVDVVGTRIRDSPRHGELRPPRPHRPRFSGRRLGLEIESDVGRKGSMKSRNHKGHEGTQRNRKTSFVNLRALRG